MWLEKIKQMNIKSKLLIGTIPVLVVAFVVIGYIFVNETSDLVLNQQNAFYESFIDQLSTDFDEWLGERVREATLIAENKIIEDAAKGENPELAQKMITNFNQKSPIYENIFLADPGGNIKCWQQALLAPALIYPKFQPIRSMQRKHDKESTGLGLSIYHRNPIGRSS